MSNVSVSRSRIAWYAGFFLSLLPVASVFAEDIRITTYYPSPKGIYKTFKLSPLSAVPATCTSNAAGAMYYNSTDHRAMMCEGTAWQVPAGRDAAMQVTYGVLSGYHGDAAFPDTLVKFHATIAACNRWCANAGFNGGTSVEWSSSQAECACF